MRYKFLSHTGDAEFQAYGETLEEAFQNAAAALASLMWEPDLIENKDEKTVKISGRDREQLLVAFLEEVIFLWESQQFMLSGCRRLSIKKSAGGYRLKAVLSGDTRPERYEVSGDVKAVTYHDMEIKQNNRWTVQVVVDV
ncbi:MAG: archease [Candidatus Aminicenantes bacterium]